MEHNFKVGDVVVPTLDTHLRSGSDWYTHAMVVSVDPLVLVSSEADMRWSATVDHMSLKVVGKATPQTMKICNTRLKN